MIHAYLRMTSGVKLRYSNIGKLCWNQSQIYSGLYSGEYTIFGFTYYAKWNGCVYVHKGNWDSAANPDNWEKIVY